MLFVAVTVLVLVCVGAQTAAGFGANCERRKAFDAKAITVSNNDMPADFKVAFIGDQGLGSNPQRTMQQALDFGIDALFHQGDFDYESSPPDWEALVDSVLGPDFPYFASMGNHDFLQWNTANGYRERLERRMGRIGANCTGDYGEFSACAYRGMLFTLNGMGLAFTGHEEYNEEIFAANPTIVWKLCSWHNNNRAYQVGGKQTNVDVALYDTCRRYGAIIATGHEHSYARTHLMSSFETDTVASTNATVNIDEGFTFAFCHGLGGRSIREYVGNLPNNPWWAATAASDDGVNHGPLLCTFNIGGDLRRGSCFFTDIDGNTWDSFDIYNSAGQTAPPPLDRCRATSVQPQLHRNCDAAENTKASLRQSSPVYSMRFPLAVSADDLIQSASLELLGFAAKGNVHSSVINITVTHLPAAAAAAAADSCDHGSSSSSSWATATGFATVQTSWQLADTEFDEPIWLSSDLGPAVEMIIRSPLWQRGDSVVVVLHADEADEATELSFATATDSPCHAPALAVYFNHCFDN